MNIIECPISDLSKSDLPPYTKIGKYKVRIKCLDNIGVLLIQNIINMYYYTLVDYTLVDCCNDFFIILFLFQWKLRIFN